jgi:hypothetical protein
MLGRWILMISFLAIRPALSTTEQARGDKADYREDRPKVSTRV